MSKITLHTDKVFEDVLKALLREEDYLKSVEHAIVKRCRSGFWKWFNKGISDEEIIAESLYAGVQRCHIEMDIDKLKALCAMCRHGIQENVPITLCTQDYELTPALNCLASN